MLDRITWFRQSALRWTDGERIVYIDPWGTAPDDPPADIIFITHAHEDHLQPDEIERLRKDGTKLVAPHDIAAGGVHFTTVPAYNTREEALQFHPQANRWVGYVLELGGARYYHAGDTDHLLELEAIVADVAFLPIGGYYTMDPDEAAGLARRSSRSRCITVSSWGRPRTRTGSATPPRRCPSRS